MEKNKKFDIVSTFNIVGMKFYKEGFEFFKKERELEKENTLNHFDLTLFADDGQGVSVFYKDGMIGKIATAAKFLDEDDCSGRDVERGMLEKMTTKAVVEVELVGPILNGQEAIKVRVSKIFYPDTTTTSHSGILLSSGYLIGNYGYVNTNTNTSTKENKSMRNITSMFNKFGSDFNYNTSNFAISMFGGLAVKSGGTFVTYDAEKNTAVDVMDFIIDGFSDMIMIMPAQKLEKGDIFIQNGKVYQMIGAKEFYSYEDGTISNLVEKKNIMGFQMYAKVFNVMSGFAAAEGEGGNMFANPMLMMMMMKDGDGDVSNMMQMMMMSQMFQGGGFKF